MQRRMDVKTDGCREGQIQRWMDIEKDVCSNGYLQRKMDVKMDRHRDIWTIEMDGCREGYMQKRMDVEMDGCRDGWILGRMDIEMDGCKEGWPRELIGSASQVCGRAKQDTETQKLSSPGLSNVRTNSLMCIIHFLDLLCGHLEWQIGYGH